jgi:2'-5' RNA ligase
VTLRARLFVGLAPDPSTAADLEAAAARVLDPSRWRIYGPRDIHLTLCFLGDVDSACAEPLALALAEGCSGLAAPELEIVGLGAFPDADHPRAVWAGVRGRPAGLEALRAIRHAVLEAVERLDLPHDARPEFVPHLTLARPRGGTVLDAGPDALGGGRPWRPTEVILFESTGGAGERYRRRSISPLNAS